MELGLAGGYPRVLVVDAGSFNRRTDLGILKSNLYEGWPADSLAQVIIGHDLPDLSICRRYWRVTREDLIRGRSGGEIAPEDLDRSSPPEPRKGHSNRLRSQSWADQLLAVLGYLPSALPIHLGKALRSWLHEVRPQVIFTLGASLGVFAAVRQFSDELGIPVVPYFTDDWIKWMYRRGPLDAFLRNRLGKAFQDCLQRSPMRLTISDAMAEEYVRRYGGQFSPCMDHVALDKFEYTPYKVDQKGVKLLFAGVLEPDRWRSLLLLVESLKSLREEGLNVSLDIYTFPAQIEKYGSQLDSPPASRVHEAVPFAEVPRLLSGADILVHVETFGLQYEAMITLSLSTKIPQYMAAGRAVLGIGAGHLASMQYLEKSGSGIVVAQKDGAALKEAVKSMVCDADLRIRLARRARQTAETNHDAVAGRERFRGVLAEVARSGS